MSKKELWLQNSSGVDVALSDLGVKVAANSTINVFAYNPYLTEERVRLSLKEGSMYKRLKSGTLKMVKGKPGDKEKVSNLTQSKVPLNIIKSKTSVLVDNKTDDILEGGNLSDIADYGLGELDAVSLNKSNGAVVIEQRQDQPKKEEPTTKAAYEIVKGQNVSGQSIVVMTKQVECQKSAVDDLVNSSANDKPFYVAAEKTVVENVVVKPVVELEPVKEVVEDKVEEEVKVEEKPVEVKNEGMRVASKSKAVAMKVKRV